MPGPGDYNLNENKYKKSKKRTKTIIIDKSVIMGESQNIPSQDIDSRIRFNQLIEGI